jgi:hypothetical protein
MVMVVFAFNSSTREAKAKGLQVPGQPQVHSKMLSQTENTHQIKKGNVLNT